MKSFYFLFLFLISLNLFSFEFEVSEFVKLDKEPEVTVKDVNDRACAKLTIYSDIEKVSFSSYGVKDPVEYDNKKKSYTFYYATNYNSIVFKHKDFYKYKYVFKDRLLGGATYKLVLGKKIDSKNPETFDVDKTPVTFSKLESVISSVLVSKQSFEPQCKSLIYIVSDLPVSKLKSLFNLETIYFTCNTEYKTEECNDEIMGLDKVVCVKDKYEFSLLLNKALLKQNKLALTFDQKLLVEPGSTYNLFITW